MKQGILIGAFAFMLVLSASAQTMTAADILALSDEQLAATIVSQASVAEAVAPRVAAPTGVSLAEFQAAQAALKQKDAVIAKLSAHLSSALTRLNQGDSRDYTSQKLAVAMALKSRLEKENASLKQDIADLHTEVAQSQRKMQLFDLENRRLVDAFSPSRDIPVERIAQAYLDNSHAYAVH